MIGEEPVKKGLAEGLVEKGLIKLKVIPNSKKEELAYTEGGWRLYLKAAPEKGKANLAVVKFFKKERGLRVEIQSGEKSREKVLKILDA